MPGEGDWYARNMYLPKHTNYQFHTTNYGHPSQFGYKDILTVLTLAGGCAAPDTSKRERAVFNVADYGAEGDG